MLNIELYRPSDMYEGETPGGTTPYGGTPMGLSSRRRDAGRDLLAKGRFAIIVLFGEFCQST